MQDLSDIADFINKNDNPEYKTTKEILDEVYGVVNNALKIADIFTGGFYSVVTDKYKPSTLVDKLPNKFSYMNGSREKIELNEYTKNHTINFMIIWASIAYVLHDNCKDDEKKDNIEEYQQLLEIPECQESEEYIKVVAPLLTNKDIIHKVINSYRANTDSIKNHFPKYKTFYETNFQLSTRESLNEIKNVLSESKIINISTEKMLTHRPEANEFFLGREELSSKVLKKLLENDNPLLICGIGGIGKTSLSKELFGSQYNFFDKLAYIEVENDFKSSMLKAFYSFKPQSSNNNTQFDELMGMLSNISEKTFLIIDNLKKQGDYNCLTRLPTNIKVLVTSRFELCSNRVYINVLSKEVALELFLHYYDTDEIDILYELLDYLGYHTLFIELTAKVLDENSNMSINDLLEEFRSGKLSKLTLTDLDSGIEKPINIFLERLFDIGILSNKHASVLRKFSLFPSIYFHQDLLKDYLVEETVAKKMNFLAKKGWVIKSKNTFKLHEIIKMYIFHNHRPDYELSKDIIKYFDKTINSHWETEQSKLVEDSSLSLSILSVLDEMNNKIVDLKYVTSAILREIGNYPLAEKLIKDVISYIIQLDINKFPLLSTYYNHLGYIYQNTHEYKRSVIELEKSIDIENLKEDIDFHILSISYNTLAITYKNFYLSTQRENYKYIELSKEYIDKAIDIRENKIEKDPEKLGYVYNNASTIYTFFDIQKALNYAEKALKIRIDFYSYNHLRLSSSYNNVASLYNKQNINLEKAIQYLEISIDILVSNFGVNHPTLYIQYKNLAESYFLIGDKENGKRYKEKSKKNAEISFDNDNGEFINLCQMLNEIENI